MTGHRPLRDVLRELPVFATPPPPFDPLDVPDDPATLFLAWLDTAIAAGAPEPHAMTVATVDADGVPDVRVLVLKDLDARGWWFASSSTSAKGHQLAHHPRAALSFHWPTLGRQVRVRGPVTIAPPDEAAADFRARTTGSRAIALASAQSSPLDDPAAVAVAADAATARLADDPDLVSPSWALYCLEARDVELWQAHPGRQHTRLRYVRDGTSWTRGLLWP